MAHTIIKVKCTDQTLEITEAPVVASGGFNEDKILFEFCPLWDGFTKTATFYVTKEDVYTSEVDFENTCVVPHEVLENPGNIFFGVFGVKGDGTTRTSEVIKYKIVQGAITADTKPSDPTPDIYEQILARLNNITTGGVTVDSVLSDTSTNPIQNKAVSAALKNKVESKTLEAHTVGTENPHAVTAEQTGALPIQGGIMTGAINMDGNSLVGLPHPTTDDEPATKGYVDNMGFMTEIPIASREKIGAVKVGESLKISTDGLLNTAISFPVYLFGSDFANVLLNVKSAIVEMNNSCLVVPDSEYGGNYYSDITGGLMLAVGNGASSVRFDFYGKGADGKYIAYNDGDSTGLYIDTNISSIQGPFQISYVKVENEGITYDYDYESGRSLAEVKYFALTPLNGAMIS